MYRLILHPNTQLVIDGLVDNPKQSVLLLGEDGSGKHVVAESLVSRILAVPLNKVASHPYVKFLSGEEKPIQIESVRELHSFVKLKAPKTNQEINRAICIEHASNMSTEAQNALLKLLEEPPEHTMLLLTARNEAGLLDTILSRVTKLSILPISKAIAVQAFGEDYKEPEIIKAYAISGGRVGLLSTILSGKDHGLLKDIDTAKAILAEPVKDRLLRTDSLAKDKSNIHQLLAAFLSISHAALTAASQQGKVESVKIWHRRQDAALKANVMLAKNANTKLLLDDLFIKL